MTGEAHVHFVCKGCREIFCTAKPEYTGMVEGAACPSCHIATVTAIGEIPSGPGDALEDIVEQLPQFLQRFQQDQDELASLRQRQVIAVEQIARALVTRKPLTAEALRDAFRGAPPSSGQQEWLNTCDYVVQVLRERGY